MNTTLFDRIQTEYVQAYKAKDSVRVSVLRLVKTAVKNRLVEEKRPGGVLSDAEMLEVLVKESKQRQDSWEQFTAAGRQDLADKERVELEILKEYLPSPLTPEELAAVIATAIADTGATSAKDMGKVMQAIMAQYKGRVDGKVLSAAVRQALV